MLSMIHSAEVPQWDIVFLAGLEDSTLPSRHADTEVGRREAPCRLYRHDADAVPSRAHLIRRALRRECLTIAVPLEIPGRNIQHLLLGRAPCQGRRRALAASRAGRATSGCRASQRCKREPPCKITEASEGARAATARGFMAVCLERRTPKPYHSYTKAFRQLPDQWRNHHYRPCTLLGVSRRGLTYRSTICWAISIALSTSMPR